MPLATYLRECGYTVIETGGGEEALTVLQQDQYRIDVVLTDAELPGALDGFSLAQWVRKNRPEVSMLIAATPERAAAVAGEIVRGRSNARQALRDELVADRIRQLLGSRRRSDL